MARKLGRNVQREKADETKGKNLLYQWFYKINMLFTILVAYNKSTTVINIL
jgi:hypothetical protein